MQHLKKILPKLLSSITSKVAIFMSTTTFNHPIGRGGCQVLGGCPLFCTDPLCRRDSRNSFRSSLFSSARVSLSFLSSMISFIRVSSTESRSLSSRPPRRNSRHHCHAPATITMPRADFSGFVSAHCRIDNADGSSAMARSQYRPHGSGCEDAIGDGTDRWWSIAPVVQRERQETKRDAHPR